MAKPVKIKKTFDFGKLAGLFPSIIVEGLNVIGKRANNAIQDGVESGKDINGKAFEKLKPVTIELGGSKPLLRSGNMKKTKLKPATVSDPKFTIEMRTKYGAFHNTGFVQTNKKQWFHGSKVPQREWFGMSKTVLPGGEEFKKTMLEIRARLRIALKK